MINIIIGAVLLIGGLSGNLRFKFADDPKLLAAVGAVLIVWGISQVRRHRRANAEFQQQREDRNPSPEFNPPPENES